MIYGSLSPPHADDDDLTLGMKIPLPTGSMSPDKGYSENTSPAPEDRKLTVKPMSPVIEESKDAKESPKVEAKDDNCK